MFPIKSNAIDLGLLPLGCAVGWTERLYGFKWSCILLLLLMNS